MHEKRKRLLLADDHASVLREICNLLTPEFDVIGTAADGAELVSAARKFKPDVIVSDIRMPRLTGIEASREIFRQRLCDAVVLLTVNGDSQSVRIALETGARGYVLKVNAGQDLIPAIQEALRGRTFVSSDLCVT